MGAVAVVFDTNVIISAAGFGGVPEESIIRAFEDDVRVVTSEAALDELDRVLEYDHLPFDDDAQEDIPFAFLHLTDAEVINPEESLDVFNDPDDNKFLECAVEVGADYFISGDEQHVQAIEGYRDVQIVSPREFLNEMNG